MRFFAASSQLVDPWFEGGVTARHSARNPDTPVCITLAYQLRRTRVKVSERLRHVVKPANPMLYCARVNWCRETDTLGTPPQIPITLLGILVAIVLTTCECCATCIPNAAVMRCCSRHGVPSSRHEAHVAQIRVSSALLPGAVLDTSSGPITKAGLGHRSSVIGRVPRIQTRPKIVH